MFAEKKHNKKMRQGYKAKQKIPVFKETRPYLNLLNFDFFFKKNKILCILKGKMLFKMHKIILLFQIKKIKYVCLPYLKFPDPLPKHTYYFIWPNV